MNRENYVYQASNDGPHSTHGKLHASISNKICPKDKIVFFFKSLYLLFHQDSLF